MIKDTRKSTRNECACKEGFADADWIELIPEQVDRERMIKFIEADSTYRPGKALLNGDKARSIKDIFGSCILKK